MASWHVLAALIRRLPGHHRLYLLYVSQPKSDLIVQSFIVTSAVLYCAPTASISLLAFYLIFESRTRITQCLVDRLSLNSYYLDIIQNVNAFRAGRVPADFEQR